MAYQLPHKPQVRQPRAIVLLNGVPVPYLEWETHENFRFEAGTFRVSMAIARLPAAFSLANLRAMEEVEVEIRAGFPKDPANFTPSSLTAIMTGYVDNLRPDYVQGLLELSGRDVVQRFIDTKTSEKFPNQTASEIIQNLVTKRGFTFVYTPTETKVGTFYAQDHVRSQEQRTEWDLMTYLARQEGYMLFSSGKEVYFRPLPSDDGSSPVMEVNYRKADEDGGQRGDFTSIAIDQSKMLSRDIKVTVRSWNHRQKKGFSRVAGSGKAGALQYSYSFPGLTPAQAEAKADALYKELARHEVTLSFEGPASDDLVPAAVIHLKGTDFDQTFYQEEIERTFSVGDGYKWRVDARNKRGDAATDGDTATSAPVEEELEGAP